MLTTCRAGSWRRPTATAAPGSSLTELSVGPRPTPGSAGASSTLSIDSIVRNSHAPSSERASGTTPGSAGASFQLPVHSILDPFAKNAKARATEKAKEEAAKATEKAKEEAAKKVREREEATKRQNEQVARLVANLSRMQHGDEDQQVEQIGQGGAKRTTSKTKGVVADTDSEASVVEVVATSDTARPDESGSEAEGKSEPEGKSEVEGDTQAEWSSGGASEYVDD